MEGFKELTVKELYSGGFMEVVRRMMENYNISDTDVDSIHFNAVNERIAIVLTDQDIVISHI